MSDEHHAVDPPPLPLLTMAQVFAKRPLLYMGGPVTYERVLAFIDGYTMALSMVRTEAARHRNVFHPPGVTWRFTERLREEGRLRWDSWRLTLLAEAIGWTDEEPPSTAGLSESQEHAAIQALIPLLETVFDETKRVATGVRPNIEERHA